MTEKIPGGYMLVAKKIFDSELMKKPPLYSKLFLWMLGQAAFKDTNKLKRGEFFTTIAEMREAMGHFVGYRKETPTVKQIRNIYEGLTKGNTIGTTKGTKGLKITILNYEYYQDAANYEGHDERVHGGHAKVITPTSIPYNRNKEEIKVHSKSTSKSTFYTDEFEEVWQQYPNGKNKKKSFERWEKMNGDKPDNETLIRAIKDQMPEWEKDGYQYVPMFSTWLNGERWNDKPKMLPELQSLYEELN